MKDNPEPSEAPQKIQQGFFARLNQTLTEVGIKTLRRRSGLGRSG